MKKKALIAVTAAVCILGLTACGGGTKKGEAVKIADHYAIEEKDLGLKEGGPSQTYVKDNMLYFSSENYPEYPQELQDEMEKLYEQYYGEDGSAVQAKDTVVGEVEGIDDSKVMAGGQTSNDSSSSDKSSKDDAGDVSDDDLLGDIDDVFDDSADTDSSDTDNADTDNADTDNADDTDKDDAATDGADTDSPALDSNSVDEGEMTEADKAYKEASEKLMEKYPECKPTGKMYKYDLEKGELKELFGYDIDESTISSFYVNDDGDIVTARNIYTYDDATQKSDYKIEVATYSEDGTEKSKKDTGDEFKNQSEEFGVNSVIFDKKGNLYATCSTEGGKSAVYKLDSECKQAGVVKFDVYVDSVVFDNEDNLVISSYADEGMKYNYVDFDKGQIGAEIPGVCDKDEYLTAFSGSGDYSLLLRNGTSLFLYDKAASKKTEIFKWMDCSLVGDNVNAVCPIDDGKFVCVYSEGDTSATYKLAVLSPSDEKVAAKEVIKFSSMYADSDIQAAVVAYNKKSDKYKIEYKNYGDSDDPETAMLNDIVAGNIPDIMDTSNVDVSNFAAKGILEDLTPYMEKDDTINKDYFVDGLLDVLAMDGKQYTAVKSFNLSTIAGKKSELGKYKDGWNINDLMEYYKSKPEGTMLFDYCNRESVFYNIVLSDISNYIDWNTGKCSFDSDEFKKAVEFCKSFPSDVDMEENEEIDAHALIQEGKILLNSAYISETAQLQLVNKLFDGDEIYVGYPCADGKGTYLTVATSFGMSSSSKNKDEVWNIIKELLQTKVAFESNFNSSKVQFEKMVKKDTCTEKYTDEDGNEIAPRDEGYGMGNYEVKLGPSTDAEIEQLRSMIKGAKLVTNNNAINTMLTDDVSEYFKDDSKQTIDDLAKVIQDKMTKYVNENK